jgi:hypothetical protein
VLTSPIERAASDAIGRAHRMPVPVPEFDEDALHYAGEVTPASLEPWRALAETVWNTARVEATIAGAYAAGLDITTDQSVRTGRTVAQTHGIRLDGEPAEPWFRAVLLAANRAVIAPGGVPVTAAQLARQSQAPGAVTNAPDAAVDRTSRASVRPGRSGCPQARDAPLNRGHCHRPAMPVDPRSAARPPHCQHIPHPTAPPDRRRSVAE